jgi:beta-glucosidase/6-phospho-beta-glucosidase/beta-galactosidase
MNDVTGEELAEYSDSVSEKVLEMKNSYIIKALQTEDEHNEENIINADPTEEELCEYYETYKDDISGPKEVGPDLHEAVISWAESNG